VTNGKAIIILEHFIVWMEMETDPLFRKLWGHIDEGLKAGIYTLVIKDGIYIIILVYNVTQFDTIKSVIISSSNPLGYSSYTGYFLVAAGGLSLMMILILWVILVTNQNKKFDFTVLKWN
jgi:hypothetical protein